MTKTTATAKAICAHDSEQIDPGDTVWTLDRYPGELFCTARCARQV